MGARTIKCYIIEYMENDFSTLREAKRHIETLCMEDKEKEIGTYILGVNSEYETITITGVKGVTKQGKVIFSKTEKKWDDKDMKTLVITERVENVAPRFHKAIWRQTKVNRIFNSAKEARKMYDLSKCNYHYEDESGKKLGGKFNPSLKYKEGKRAGWTFSKKKENELKELLKGC